jgi:hypothetical protein
MGHIGGASSCSCLLIVAAIEARACADRSTTAAAPPSPSLAVATPRGGRREKTTLNQQHIPLLSPPPGPEARLYHQSLDGLSGLRVVCAQIQSGPDPASQW